MKTHLSLFSGIGGLDIAAEWAGFATVGQCEWADYQTKVLEKHWPDVPRWRDIRTLNGASFYERTGLRTVDVVSGGFPCQPFSVAGKQKGKGDERYLWPEMLRIIRELAPRWVVGENVPGIIRIAGRDVAEDLEREGYDVAVFDFEAAAVGTPHRRERIAFVANLHGDRGDAWRPECKIREREFAFIGSGNAVENTERTEWGPCKPEGDDGNGDNAGWKKTAGGFGASGKNGRSLVMADASRGGLQGLRACGERQREASSETGPTERRCTLSYAESGGEQRKLASWREAWRSGCRGWWAVEPDVGRLAYGIPNRVDRLKCLGNAVVPQQFFPIFKAIAEIEEDT